VTYARLGGRGIAEVVVTAMCPGTESLEVCREEFVFTSPDLNGTCNTNTTSTSVIDFGIWVACFMPSPPCITSDYNCDCATNILDIGLYAYGLFKHCGGAVCP
jgi:hypothetical protein